MDRMSEWVSVNIQYDELVILTKKEYFIMSLESLTSAIGGFLGLFLGFSCLSITFWTQKHHIVQHIVELIA